MKRSALLFIMFLMALSSLARYEYIRIWQGGESMRVPIKDIVYSGGGRQFTVSDQVFHTAEIDSITLVHTVWVSYQQETVSVEMNGTPGISYQLQGADVVLTNNNTTQEVEFVLSGYSSNGSFSYNGSYKCKFHLNGLDLTSQKGAAIDIQCGKRIDLILSPGTTNMLTDAKSGTQKACFFCRGHLEIDGSGSLSITGNTRHALATNEYLKCKKGLGTLNVLRALGDAIHAGQYFQMNGGVLNINGMEGDGIQAEATDDSKDEFNGQVFIKGGSVQMNVEGDDVKGIKSDGDLTISGGTLCIDVNGDGSRGISCGQDMYIHQEDGPTNLLINANGGVYVNPMDKKDTNRCMGIKVDRDLTISDGTITVRANGEKARTIKVSGTYCYRGGQVDAGSIDYGSIKR